MEKGIEAVENPSSQGLEERKLLSRKVKYMSAAAIFYGNIVFGCAYNTYGPTVTSFQTKYETDDATISRVFTILTACYMVGALTGGLIFNYVNRQFVVITILGIIAAMMFLTPHCPTMTLYFITAGVVGLCGGSYDTAQFVWMMEMMQADCPPYVQSQHFFYAVGTNLGSVIMAPFLDKEKEEETNTTMTIVNDNYRYSNESINEVAKSDVNEQSDPSKLFIPYTIVGFLMVTSVAYHLFLFTFFRYSAPPPEEPGSRDSSSQTTPIESEQSSEVISDTPLGRWSWHKLRFVILSCCFYGAYQGMEMCTFQFFPKFGQNSDLHLTESESAYTLTGMTAAYAVGRGIAIIAVFKISTQLILCGNLVLVVIANILLVAWAKSSLPMLWASSILFGLGFSSIYASFSAYIERHLNFTNFITSLMIVCGSGVAAIYPVVVGNFIEENPTVLSYTSFFSIVFMILSFGTLCYLTFKNKVRYM